MSGARGVPEGMGADRSDSSRGRNDRDAWRADPLVRACGGLAAKAIGDDTVRDSAESRPLALLDQVFERNVSALDGSGRAVADIALLVARSRRPRACAVRRREDGARGVVVTLGLLEDLYSTVAGAAHAPHVLARAWPVASTCRPPAVDPALEDASRWALPRERSGYFLTVLCFMLEFVVLHEIAHHLRDHHVLARARTDGVDRTGSSAERPCGGDLEFDADVQAVELGLESLFVLFPRERWTTDEALKQLFLMVFAQLLVAQGLAPREIAGAGTASDDYPPPVFRARVVAHLTARTLHRELGGNWERYRDAHDCAWTEASFVAAAMGRERGIWHGDEIAPEVTREHSAREAALVEALSRIDVLVGSRVEAGTGG